MRGAGGGENQQLIDGDERVVQRLRQQTFTLSDLRLDALSQSNVEVRRWITGFERFYKHITEWGGQ